MIKNIQLDENNSVRVTYEDNGFISSRSITDILLFYILKELKKTDLSDE